MKEKTITSIILWRSPTWLLKTGTLHRHTSVLFQKCSLLNFYKTHHEWSIKKYNGFSLCNHSHSKTNSLPCVPTGKTITPTASLKHFSKYPTTMQKEITEYLVNLVILDRLDLHEYRCVAPGETTDGAPIQICLFLCVQDGIQKQPKLPSRRSRKEA